MKKLNFKLVSNDKVIIDEECSYYSKDNNINFHIKDDIYIYDTTNNILTKRNESSEISIDMIKNIISFTTKEYNKTFDLLLKNSNKILNNDNNVEFHYNIEENDINNIIYINY